MSMYRRQYLARGAVGTAALAALAGCLDDTGDDSADVGDRTGERALDRAAGSLNEAAIELQFEDGAIEDPEDLEFDPEPPAAHIADARDHIETAESELPDDRQPDTETLRTYADVLEGLVSVTGTVADDSLEDDVDAVFAAIGGDGELKTANGIVDERTAALEAANTEYADLTDAFDALDAERLDDLASIDRAEFEDGIEVLGSVLDSLTALGDGFAAILDGYADLEDGQEYADDGEYERAEDAFLAAESSFETATATLEDDAETPGGLERYFDTALCQSGHLTDAADAFADSADAAASGDPITADQRRSDGEAHLEDAADCAQ